MAQLGCSGTVVVSETAWSTLPDGKITRPQRLIHVGISSHARSKTISPRPLLLCVQRASTTAASDVSIEEL
jgi:hypothetical protein